MRRSGISAVFAVAALVLLTAPWFGAKFIMPSDISAGTPEARIFWQLRVPRVFLAWCAGATFGLCGMSFQALFRNPLAEPSILGVSSGAAFGASVAIRLGIGAGILGRVAIPVSAFAGAILAVGVISMFSRMAGGAGNAALLLAGVAVSSLFSSMIMVFQYTGGSAESYRLLSWAMGGISAVGARDGFLGVPALAIAFCVTLFYSSELDLLTFGDEIALTRGVELERTRRLLFAGMSMSVAIVVANCGPIAFLGLVAPHVARRIVGPRHRILAPCSAAVGGTALAICDTAARTLWSPSDLPVGIIISFLGAPFFLWLLFGKRTW
jgi:iron complex transport system permease protein